MKHSQILPLPTANCLSAPYVMVKQDKHIFAIQVPVDLAAMENGGMVVGWSDMHFGHPRNLIAPGLAANMGEGWETARRVRICLVGTSL